LIDSNRIESWNPFYTDSGRHSIGIDLIDPQRIAFQRDIEKALKDRNDLYGYVTELKKLAETDPTNQQ